jgi:hypothetical protein
MIVGGVLRLGELFDIAEASIGNRLHRSPLGDHPGLH